MALAFGACFDNAMLSTVRLAKSGVPDRLDLRNPNVLESLRTASLLLTEDERDKYLADS